MVVGNLVAAIVRAVGGLRPAVIAALDDQVHLVAALRTHLRCPQLPVRSERQAEDVAMAHRRNGARRCAQGLPARALRGQVDDLAEVAVRILRRGHLLPIARGDEHRSVGREGDAVREMAVAGHLRRLPPDHLEAVDARLAPAEDQAPIAERRAARAVRPCLRVAQVDALVAGEIRMGDDVAEPALTRDLHGWNAGHLLLAAGRGLDQPKVSAFLGDRAMPVICTPLPGRKVHRPGRIEAGNFGDGEGAIRRRIAAPADSPGAAPQAARSRTA